MRNSIQSTWKEDVQKGSIKKFQTDLMDFSDYFFTPASKHWWYQQFYLLWSYFDDFVLKYQSECQGFFWW